MVKAKITKDFIEFFNIIRYISYHNQIFYMEPDIQNYHTIIIGSGIAGINAAYKLIQKDIKVLVLQSNNHIGGRMNSINMKLACGQNFWFDQGASWIHGYNKKHPIAILSKKVQGLKTIETQEDQVIVYDQKGKDVSKKTFNQQNAMEKIIEKCYKQPGSTTIYQEIQKIDSSKLKNPFFMYNISIDIQFQTSGSIDLICAQKAEDDQQFEGKEVMILSGYSKFVENLIKQGNIPVLLNHQVIQVVKHQGLSRIKCLNGKVFLANNVIFAVPIGVLKKNLIRCQPQFPIWKKKAINNLLFGNVCKVLIQFTKSITSKKQHYIGVVANDVKKRGLATYFLNIEALTGLPLLMTFGLGQNADQIQKMNQNDLKKLIADRVNTFADRKVEIDDFNIKRTKWRQDSNFGGSYTYPGTQTQMQDWKNMSKPIFSQHWYFCGEHTTQQYRGTVHGAFLSGQFTAETIINNISQNNWKYFDQ